ncbi:MAG: YecA family protein, partial [Xanthomonadaceae bacterium]|nr:YecA family protein [Xanthomonadaceae bacterium]
MTARTEWPSSLDDNELDELDRYLRVHTGEGDLLLDGVHGLLSALAVGPMPVLPEEWLPEVLHEPFADENEGNRVLALLAKLNDSIPAELDVDAYEPILGEVELETGLMLSAAGWCEGFSRGIDLRANLWERRLAEDPQLMELLGPVMALAVDEGILSAEAEFEKLSDDEY